MTEVLESVLNGMEGDEDSPMNDDTGAGGDKSLVIAEAQEDKGGESDGEGLAGAELEDTTDSILSHSGANLIITTDDEKEQMEGNDDDDEGKLEIDANENGDDGNMEMSTDITIKMEDVDVDEVEEQNSNDSESALIIATDETDGKKILQNGNEENSSCSSSGDNSKPMSGLLNKGPSTSMKKARQELKSFSIADGNVIANELEEQITKINAMLALKEQEWGAILRLKKHMEYALEQVKCTQRMAKGQDDENGPMSTTEIKAAIDLITCEPDIRTALSTAEKRIEESIGNTEMENSSLQIIFPFGSERSSSPTASSTKIGSTLVKRDTSETGQGMPNLSASAILQKLVERKRKAMDDAQPQPQSKGPRLQPALRMGAQSSTSAQGQRQAYGAKGGAAVPIQIQRLKGQRPTAKRAIINMSPDRMYAKTLENLVAMAQADKLQKESSIVFTTPVATSVPQITNTRTLATSRPKNGKPAARQATSSNSLLIANPTPGGSGTLAKMLSPSAHSTGISSNRGDASNNASQKYSNKLPSSEANLSLANLLATSKVESKVSLAKVKKERMREDDTTSHVPSQQQAESVPICQGCNLSRAQFVCAGCANQWYCSRECQVAAWDEHSEICSG